MIIIFIDIKIRIMRFNFYSALACAALLANLDLVKQVEAISIEERKKEVFLPQLAENTFVARDELEYNLAEIDTMSDYNRKDEDDFMLA
ncbi:MAG: hypothetical protein GY841_06525 [FCB group bacterium]|nr:hypothetical protein [FCB group bacterium]